MFFNFIPNNAIPFQIIIVHSTKYFSVHVFNVFSNDDFKFCCYFFKTVRHVFAFIFLVLFFFKKIYIYICIVWFSVFLNLCFMLLDLFLDFLFFLNYCDCLLIFCFCLFLEYVPFFLEYVPFFPVYFLRFLEFVLECVDSFFQLLFDFFEFLRFFRFFVQG